MTRRRSPIWLEWVDPAVCSLDYRLKVFGRLSFFKYLPSEAISKINALFLDCDLRADERVYYEEDNAEYLFLVAMG